MQSEIASIDAFCYVRNNLFDTGLEDEMISPDPCVFEAFAA